MLAKATVKNVRISPRKVRLVLDLIRNKTAVEALAYLNNTHRAAVPVVRTLLRSALSNAEQKDSNVEVDELSVTEAYANEGPSLKRFRPRAMGRASRIKKRTSHITLVVG